MLGTKQGGVEQKHVIGVLPMSLRQYILQNAYALVFDKVCKPGVDSSGGGGRGGNLGV